MDRTAPSKGENGSSIPPGCTNIIRSKGPNYLLITKMPMKPEKVELYNRMADIAKWTGHMTWFVPVVGLVVGLAFYLQEPINEPVVDAVLLAAFYLAWGIFGLRVAIWGLAGVLTKSLMFQNVEMALSPVHSEGETQGWKAVTVGLLSIFMSLIVFIIPGFLLGLGQLIFFLR